MIINDYSYQSNANITCLLEDTEYGERKNGFFKIIEAFEKEKIRWGIACSMNLFLRGIVDDFHDLDLLVEYADIEKIKKVMNELGAILVGTGGNGFCESEVYLHYQLGRVDVDFIAGFRVITFGTQFLYRFNENELDFITIEDKNIPMISMEALYLLYSMMEGWQPKRRYKRVLIEEYLLSKKLKYEEIFKKAIEGNLPAWIKRNIKQFI